MDIKLNAYYLFLTQSDIISWVLHNLLIYFYIIYRIFFYMAAMLLPKQNVVKFGMAGYQSLINSA
jgi:hypothetical protein